jgi:hypothetical protein
MNSKQRRKEKRKFPFVIEVDIRNGNYEEFWKILDWCDETFVPDSWVVKQNPDHIITRDFKFVHQKDAVYFSLKCL